VARLDDPDPITARSDFRLAGWIFAALVATAAFGGFIGWAAAGKDATFDWNVGAVAATAFGTTVLAGFTGTLAYATVIDRQGKDRVLVAVRSAYPRPPEEDGTIRFDIHLRNVGAAPANYISLKIEGVDDAGVSFGGRSSNDHFLSPGEEAAVVVTITPIAERSLPEDIKLRVLGVYLDSVSRPGHFLWQKYPSGGTSFLFKTKPWQF
jgi:hypothetical protein